MRILLVSDVHLDSPFKWAKLEVARRRRQALRDALARSIQLAIDQRVDVICCGGDLFEHERVSPDTGQFLRALFERAHPIPIFIAPGNAFSRINADRALRIWRLSQWFDESEFIASGALSDLIRANFGALERRVDPWHE